VDDFINDGVEINEMEMLENITIRDATHDDFSTVIKLYKIVEEHNKKKEMSHGHELKAIEKVYKNSINKGIFLLIETKDTEEIIGEIHAHKMEGAAVSHVLGELGFIIDPRFHGKNLGQALLNVLLTIVKKDYPYILRLEVMIRESNAKGIDFYKSFGFKEEGRFEKRYFKPNGELESDVALVWFNPNFQNKYEIT
jgi:ribosomal protein S18 acetylase RimI-like enzyme